MRKSYSILLSTLLLGLSSTQVFAANSMNSIKIGVVDLPSVLQQAPQVQSINEKLKSEFAPKQKQIMELQNKLHSEMAKLSGEGAAKMTSEEKKKLQNTIIGDQKELQAQIIKMQDGLAHAQANEMKNFMQEIDKAASTVASKQNLDLVLLKQAVLYPSAADITKEVVSELPKK